MHKLLSLWSSIRDSGGEEAHRYNAWPFPTTAAVRMIALPSHRRRDRLYDHCRHPPSSFEDHYSVALLTGNNTAAGIGEFYLFAKNIAKFLATSKFNIFLELQAGSLTPSSFTFLLTRARWKRGRVTQSPMAPWHCMRIGLG